MIDPQNTVKQTQHLVQASFGANLSPLQMVIAAVCLVLVLWLAYRIGKVILRLAVGIVFLGLIAYGIWYLVR